MIRGVIFDLGDTLFHFEGDWSQTKLLGSSNLVNFLTARGYPLPDGFAELFLATRERGTQAHLADDLEYTAQQALTDTLAKNGVCYVPDALIPLAVEKFFDAELLYWRPVEDAPRTLQTLKQRGLKLGVFSNAPDHAFVERLACHAGVRDYFSPFVTSAVVGNRKPSPRALQPILDAWQLEPREVVMVGDAPSFDILAAHRVGMWGVLYEPQPGAAPKPHREFDDADRIAPDATIRRLSDLITVLERWTN